MTEAFDAGAADYQARIAAARAVGLSDSMADQIVFINGIPEWKPPKDEQPRPAAVNQKGDVPSEPWPNHG